MKSNFAFPPVLAGLIVWSMSAQATCPQVFHGENGSLMDAIKLIDAAREAPGGLCSDLWIYEDMVVSVRFPRTPAEIKTDPRDWEWSAMGAFHIASLNKSSQWKAAISNVTFVTITRKSDGKTCIVNIAGGGRVLKEFPGELEKTRIEVPCDAVWEQLPFPAVPATARDEISRLLGFEHQRKVEDRSRDAGAAK